MPFLGLDRFSLYYHKVLAFQLEHGYSIYTDLYCILVSINLYCVLFAVGSDSYDRCNVPCLLKVSIGYW